MCAREGGANTYRICALPFLKEFCMARLHFDELSLSAVEVTEFRVTTKRGYGSASVAVRAEKRAIKNDKIMMLFSETETAKQNQKFPFHSFSASRRRGGGRRREKNARKFFGFCTRESASVSEAHSPRNRSVRGGFKPPRAPRVRSGFEQRLIHHHHFAKSPQHCGLFASRCSH